MSPGQSRDEPWLHLSSNRPAMLAAGHRKSVAGFCSCRRDWTSTLRQSPAGSCLFGGNRCGCYSLAARFVAAVPGSGDRQPGQCGNRFRAGLMHDRSAVVLDGTLADAEFPGDNFIGAAGQDQFQDLVLSRRQRRDTPRLLAWQTARARRPPWPVATSHFADGVEPGRSQEPHAIPLPISPVRGGCTRRHPAPGVQNSGYWKARQGLVPIGGSSCRRPFLLWTPEATETFPG